MTPAGRTVAAVLLALTLTAEPVRAQPAEVVTKGAYLARFAPFVVWPAGVFPTPTAPLVICLQAAFPAGTPLDATAPELRIGARPVVVRRLTKVDPAAGCQMVFVAGSPAQSASQALLAMDGQPVLTITNEAQFPGAHGIIDMAMDGLQVSFSVDSRQAERNGLALSSKLLALAVSVKR